MSEPSFLTSIKIKIYAHYDGCVKLTDLPIDLITACSEDFLGIREANIVMIDWKHQLEIGAALALRKKVITVNNLNKINMKIHPLITVFPSWDMAYRYIRNNLEK